MKTEGVGESPMASNAVIWGSNVELPQLFTGEECLPIIGSSQVSSILSTLDSPEKASTSNVEASAVNLELIVLPVPGLEKPPEAVSKANGARKKGDARKIRARDLTYIVCDMCPFLCLKQKKITEHVELVHRNKRPSEVFEMNCPACSNTFYHKLSLQAHLMYDHCVTNTVDVTKIIQIALHSKKSTVYSSKVPVEIDINKMPIIIEGVNSEVTNRPIIHCKNEVDLKYDKASEVGCESDNEDHFHDDCLVDKAAEIIKEPVDLPTHEISQNNAEKLFNTYIKRPNGISKFLDDNKAHKCKVDSCKVRMQSPEKLAYHSRCHADTIFKCPVCGDMLSLWKTLAGHLWRAHKVDMELYRCDKCDYRTASLSRLNNTHKLIHGLLKGFVCPVCQKAFKNAKQLRNHRDTHKKPDPASCSCKECGKTFTSNHRLRIHMDGIHKKLKPYLCNYCGYKGATRGGLKMHVRQHTGEKPFTCDLCDYSTADHNSLRRHKLRHSGEKPYKCSHCDYQCIQTSTYKVHIKTKHPGLDKELLFSCAVCQFRSINREVYNSHMTSQHPETR